MRIVRSLQIDVDMPAGSCARNDVGQACPLRFARRRVIHCRRGLSARKALRTSGRT